MNAMQIEPRGSKTLHLMRHGITEMNVYLHKYPYGSKGFKDPGFYDTRLTPEGREGAKKTAKLTRELKAQPEVLVVSPLTRALHTAELAWEHYEGPVVVEPLATERMWLSSDAGRHPRELQQDFANSRFRYTFDHLAPVWWWNDHPEKDPLHTSLEPEHIFLERVAALKQYLLERPEAVIGVVAHWGLIHALTGGDDFRNCELRTYTLTPTGQLQEHKKPVFSWLMSGGQ